jgi:hypothetical protein
MALDTAGGRDPGKPWGGSTAPYFQLRLNEDGLWLIRETTGRKAGLFSTLKAAIRYAREETPGGNFVIVYQPGRFPPEHHLLGRAA